MKRRLFITGFLFALMGGLIFGQEKEDRAPVKTLVEDLRTIWPQGNCAETISGTKSYILVSVACSDSFGQSHRRKFLKKVLDTGWNVQKETYRIDPKSAAYFYKFENNDGKYLYFRMLFRNPEVVWPLHDNQRPKIAIIINNPENPADLEFWKSIKLPISVSINLQMENLNEALANLVKLEYDPLIYLLDAPKIPDSSEYPIKTYLELLKGIPEENMVFSAALLPANSVAEKDTESVRMIINSLRQFGITKLVGSDTLEISDTAKVLEMRHVGSVFTLRNAHDENKGVWISAYNRARDKGYAVVVLESNDPKTREFLLTNISENLEYIDFVRIRDLPIEENKF